MIGYGVWNDNLAANFPFILEKTYTKEGKRDGQM